MWSGQMTLTFIPSRGIAREERSQTSMNSPLALLDETFPCLAQTSYEISCSMKAQKIYSLCYARPRECAILSQPDARAGRTRGLLSDDIDWMKKTWHDCARHNWTRHNWTRQLGTTRHDTTAWTTYVGLLNSIKFRIVLSYLYVCACVQNVIKLLNLSRNACKLSAQF